jgi:hypothetical protein
MRSIVAAVNDRTLTIPCSSVIAFEGTRTYWAVITPELAVAWLERNEKNRQLKPTVVQRYQNEMMVGRWKRTHEGVAFDSAGILIDGQHRLHAIAATGLSQTLLITEGLDPQTRVAIDQGPGRTMRDNAQIMGLVEAAHIVVPILNAIRRCAFKDTDPVSFEDFSEEVAHHRAALEWAVNTIKRGGVAGRAPISAALVYAYPANPETVRRIYSELEYGATPGDPIQLLRDHLMRTERLSAQDERVETFQKILCLIHARLHDERPTKIQLSDRRIAWFGQFHR